MDDREMAPEGPNKKTRKPYTIKKTRDTWSELERDKFLEALHLFDRDWKKIGEFVGSKSVSQVRSHAQKYFLKVEKKVTIEHVPPPRPKRKAANSYPHKAKKNDDAAANTSSGIGGYSFSSSSNEPTQNIELRCKSNYGDIPDFAHVDGSFKTDSDPSGDDHFYTASSVMMLMENLETYFSTGFEDPMGLLSACGARVEDDASTNPLMFLD